jgi:hypothetical protein
MKTATSVVVVLPGVDEHVLEVAGMQTQLAHDRGVMKFGRVPTTDMILGLIVTGKRDDREPLPFDLIWHCAFVP